MGRLLPVRIGIVGCGRITTLRHLPALRRLEDVEVRALADLDADRLGAAAERFGIARRYADHEALVSDPEIEVVGVCVPAPGHAEVAVAALEASKHLLLEKPVALTLADGERIAAAAARAAGKIVVGFNLRWHRLVARAGGLVEAGAVGRVEAVTTRFTSPFAYREIAQPWRRERALGGGVLYEMAPHHFDLWRLFLGTEIVEVHALSRSTDWDDEGAVVSGRTESGAFVSSFFSQRGPEANELEVSGDKGRLRLSMYRFDSLELTPRDAPIGDLRHRLRGLGETVRELPSGLAAARRGGDFIDSYRREWQHVADVLRRGREAECTLEDGLRALEIMLAAGESATSGQTVSIQSLLAREGVA
jgi:predicted dehydrogenase